MKYALNRVGFLYFDPVDSFLSVNEAHDIKLIILGFQLSEYLLNYFKNKHLVHMFVVTCIYEVRKVRVIEVFLSKLASTRTYRPLCLVCFVQILSLASLAAYLDTLPFWNRIFSCLVFVAEGVFLASSTVGILGTNLFPFNFQARLSADGIYH